MFAEFGHFALLLILVMGCVQAVLFCPVRASMRLGISQLAPATTGNASPRNLSPSMSGAPTATGNDISLLALPFAVLVLAFIAEAALLHSFIVSDFTLPIVANYSHSSTPMLFRIGATFNGDGGAMLLWVLATSLMSFVLALQYRTHADTDTARTAISVMGVIIAILAIATIVDADPFLRNVAAPLDGNGMDPENQDVLKVLREPFLYLGLAALSVVFAHTISALSRRQLDRNWSEKIRPWVMGSWLLLGIAIAISAYRSYTEQAWGNWWYWDTAENSLLMPWLLTTALVHCRAVLEKTESLKSWTALLAISAFGVGWFGVFLTRSGLLGPLPASLNATGDSDALLIGFCVIFAGAYFLFWRRAEASHEQKSFAPISRESGMFINSVMLSLIASLVLIGTIYPLVLRWLSGEIITVGAPFFINALIPVIVPLLLLMGFAPTLRWRSDEAWLIGRRMKLAVMLSLIIILFVSIRFIDFPTAPLLGIGLAGWVLTATLGDLWARLWRTPDHGESKYRNFQLLGPRYLSMALSHIGLAILIAGGSASSVWEDQVVVSARAGQSIVVGPYNLQYEGVALLAGENYATRKATLILYRHAQPVAELYPEIRYYPTRGIETREADIWHGRDGDVHVSVGDRAEDGGRIVTVRYLPMMPWVWAGMIFMPLGGAISILTRIFLRFQKNGVPAS